MEAIGNVVRRFGVKWHDTQNAWAMLISYCKETYQFGGGGDSSCRQAEEDHAEHCV